MLIRLGKEMKPIYLGFTRSKVKVTSVTLVIKIKKCFGSLFWELFITELSYFICLFVMWITWPVLVWGSLGLRSWSQWSFFLRIMYYGAIVFHMLIGLRGDMTPIDFTLLLLLFVVTLCWRSRSQRSLVNMVFAHNLENYLSQSFYISHADWSWRRHDPVSTLIS